MKIFLPYSVQSNHFLCQLYDDIDSRPFNLLESKNFFFIWSVLQYKPDIVHFHWLNSFFLGKNIFTTICKALGFVLQLLILKIMQIKIIWSIHNLENHNKNHLLVDQILRKTTVFLADKLTVPCKSAKELISKRYDICASELIVLELGNYENFYPTTNQEVNLNPIEEDDFLFLCFGGIRKYRNYDRLISAFKNLNNSSVKLCIAGPPFDTDLVEQIDRRVSTESRIIFKPKKIPRSKVGNLITQADAMVYPFRNILSSASVILGTSYSKVCVAPRLGCINDYLQPENNFLYEKNESNGLENQLKRCLLTNPEALREMGKQNKEFIMENNWNQTRKQLRKLYIDLR